MKRIKNQQKFILTLAKPVASEVKIEDAIENVTATPGIWIHHTIITRIATPWRRVLIEYNRFENTHMSGIFINDDASGWFELGMVKDLIISNNRFYHCGEPVIENTINGRNAVHNNIKVLDNYFWLHGSKLLQAKSSGNIKISGNTIYNASSIDSVLKFVDSLYLVIICYRNNNNL